MSPEAKKPRKPATAPARKGLPTVGELDRADAVAVLQRLVAAGGAVEAAVHEAVRETVAGLDPEGVAAEVRYDLESLTPEDCWERSGPSRHGYVDPGEAAWEMVEEVLDPHLRRLRKLQSWGMEAEAGAYCLAVLQGIHDFDRESDTEFRSHSPDDADLAFAWFLGEYRGPGKRKSFPAEFLAAFHERFPDRGSALPK
jgi:hypothetical protein